MLIPRALLPLLLVFLSLGIVSTVAVPVLVLSAITSSPRPTAAPVAAVRVVTPVEAVSARPVVVAAVEPPAAPPEEVVAEPPPTPRPIATATLRPPGQLQGARTAVPADRYISTGDTTPTVATTSAPALAASAPNNGTAPQSTGSPTVDLTGLPLSAALQGTLGAIVPRGLPGGTPGATTGTVVARTPTITGTRPTATITPIPSSTPVPSLTPSGYTNTYSTPVSTPTYDPYGPMPNSLATSLAPMFNGLGAFGASCTTTYCSPTPTPCSYYYCAPTPNPYASYYWSPTPTPCPYYYCAPTQTPCPYYYCVSTPTPCPYYVCSPTPDPYTYSLTLTAMAIPTSTATPQPGRSGASGPAQQR